MTGYGCQGFQAGELAGGRELLPSVCDSISSLASAAMAAHSILSTDMASVNSSFVSINMPSAPSFSSNFRLFSDNRLAGCSGRRLCAGAGARVTQRGRVTLTVNRRKDPIFQSFAGLRHGNLPLIRPMKPLGRRELAWAHSLRGRPTYSNPEPTTALDDSKHEAGWTAEKNSHGFRRQADDKWNVDNDDEMLRLMEGFKDFYPIIRTYRNELCTLEICGSALRSSVLTAMGLDRSFTAASNLLMGRRLTVLQTILPGSSGDHSTVSTKLFAPSLQVVEKAKKVSLPNGFSAREFVHKFFEAVQMLQLSKFYIEIHAPGTARDMSALDREEMVQIVCSFEASNKSALDQFGKAIALYAISCIKENASGRTFSSYLKKTWNKSGWIPSQLSPVRFSMLSTEEIQSQAKCLTGVTDLLENATNYSRPNRSWWPAPASGMDSAKRCLDKATEDWIHEYLPMHKLHIDLGMLDAKVDRGRTISGQSKEVLLTHAQLVDLAGALDLYYEDRFTLSDKSLQSGAMLDFHCVSRSKTARFLEATAIGSIILGAGIFAWLVAARLRRPSRLLAGNLVLNTVDVAAVSKSELPFISRNREPDLPANEQLPADEMESLCKLVVTKMVKAFSWDVQIQSCVGKGAWTENQSAESNSVQKSTEILLETPAAASENAFEEGEAATELDKLSQLKRENKDDLVGKESEMMQRYNAQSSQETLLYQVVLSRDGSFLGFQPLNQAAVSTWAAMPLAQILHRQQKLTPGLWERPLKYEGPPMDAVVLELHIVMDPACPYVFARPSPL